jgi:hypothetical protein
MEYGLSFLREVHGFKVSGVSVQVSAQPLAKQTASLIGKETLALRSLSKSEYRISNHEYRMSKECILTIL